ncbi:hypothetical protein [Sphingomonas montanisoli]|uniref:Uncharacterized protein n=1 Tax=Sphingomonas montanisoli TaxID=2606412 RepID=A0A5D9C3D7_9SPHN|nr:hypothetical protein [Sphingomonas montanisoli]TZG25797.1 hypothetical protein FYJ91_12440 [Sphingomonas montanisoli]
MEAKTIGRAIGAASLAFGVTDILAGKSFGHGIGAVEGGTLFRTVGASEVVTGLIGLSFPTSSIPVWTRFAADLADMAALGPVIARPNAKTSDGGDGARHRRRGHADGPSCRSIDRPPDAHGRLTCFVVPKSPI